MPQTLIVTPKAFTDWRYSYTDHDHKKMVGIQPKLGEIICDEILSPMTYILHRYVGKFVHEEIEDDLKKHDLEGICLAAIFIDTVMLMADPERAKAVKRATFARLVENTGQFLIMKRWCPMSGYEDYRPRITHLTKLINNQKSIWELANFHTYSDSLTFIMNMYVMCARTPPAIWLAYQAYVLLGIEREIPEDVRNKARAFVQRYEKYVFKDGVKPTTQAQWRTGLEWAYETWTPDKTGASLFNFKSFILQILRKHSYEGPGPALGINEEEGSDEWWQAIQDKAIEEFCLPSLVKPMGAILTDWDRVTPRPTLFQIAIINWSRQRGREAARILLRRIPIKATYFPDM
jgi:hypothetical protein